MLLELARLDSLRRVTCSAICGRVGPIKVGATRMVSANVVDLGARTGQVGRLGSLEGAQVSRNAHKVAIGVTEDLRIPACPFGRAGFSINELKSTLAIILASGASVSSKVYLRRSMASSTCRLAAGGKATKGALRAITTRVR